MNYSAHNLGLSCIITKLYRACKGLMPRPLTSINLQHLSRSCDMLYICTFSYTQLSRCSILPAFRKAFLNQYYAWNITRRAQLRFRLSLFDKSKRYLFHACAPVLLVHFEWNIFHLFVIIQIHPVNCLPILRKHVMTQRFRNHKFVSTLGSVLPSTVNST